MSSNYGFVPTLDGLNNINANSISCETVDTIDAHISNDLSVGNNLSVADKITLDASGNIFNNGNLTSLGVTKIGPGALQAGGIASRTLNVLSTEGGIKLARNHASSGSFIEFDSVTPDWTTINNRVFIGGSTPTDERFLVRFRLGAGDQDVFVTRRTGTNVNTPLTITGNIIADANYDLVFGTGTGRINQLNATGTNYMGQINLNADKGILFGSGTGAISQSNDGVNTLSETQILGNKNLVFNTGTGYINQTNSTGTNILNAVSLKTNQDITMSGSGKITQGTGINQMSQITMNSGADLVFQGTGKIDQTGTTGTNALVKTNVTTALGAGTTPSFSVIDGTKSVNFIPNITGGSYSGINTLGDSCLFASGAQNTSVLTLTTWNNANVGIRINGNTNVVQRAGTLTTTLSSTDYSTNAITNVTNTTASTTTANGALVVSGGVGIAGTLNAGTLNCGTLTPSSISTAGSVTLTGTSSVFTQSNISLNQNNDFSKTTISTNYATTALANTLRIRDTGVTGKQFNFNPNIGAGNHNPSTVAGDSVLSVGTASNQGSVLNLTTWSSTSAGVRIGNGFVEINWGDGSKQYGESNAVSMNIIEDMNYFIGVNTLKCSTYDLNYNLTSSTQAQNLVQMGIVRVVKGESYGGVFFYASAATITFRCALYNTGASPSRLTHRTTNYTSVAGWNMCPFDASWTADATKYVCIMLVPTNTTHTTYIYNNGNTNWGRGVTAGTINLLGCNYSGFSSATGFPATFTATPATASKYFLGLY